MRAAIYVLVMAAACSGQTSAPTSAPPAPPPATTAIDDRGAIALRLVAAAKPCNVPQVAALLDREGFLRIVEQRAPTEHGSLCLLEQLFSTAANRFCAWVAGATDLRMLRTRTVDGEPHPVLRKVSDTGFGYFELRATSTADGARIVDVYSHGNGTWISQEVADTLLSPGADDPNVGFTVMRINALEDEARHADAMAALDSLPEPVRNTRAMQGLRVAIAGRTSVAAYEEALTERGPVLAEFLWSQRRP